MTSDTKINEEISDLLEKFRYSFVDLNNNEYIEECGIDTSIIEELADIKVNGDNINIRTDILERSFSGKRKNIKNSLYGHIIFCNRCYTEFIDYEEFFNRERYRREDY